MRSSCAWHQFGRPWGNASHWLMQLGTGTGLCLGVTDASKSALRWSCAWHQFGSPCGNASHYLMQTGDRLSAVRRGRMLAKVRCGRHVPGTKLGGVGHVPGTNLGGPGVMLAIG